MNIHSATMPNVLSVNAGAMDGRRRPGRRGSRIAGIIQERERDRAREMQLRQAENERVQGLRDNIMRLMSPAEDNENLNDDEMNEELLQDREAQREADEAQRQAKLALLEKRLEQTIKQIAESRLMRQELAAEREMKRQKAIIEEATQIREERPSFNNILPEDEEAEEERQVRESIRDLTNIAATQDNITNLRQTRAALASEAGQLRRAMTNDNSNYTKVGRIEGSAVRDVIVSEQSGFSDANDFRIRHLARLNIGISRLDAAIEFAISRLYGDSVRLQDSQQSGYRQDADDEENQDNRDEETGFDVVL